MQIKNLYALIKKELGLSETQWIPSAIKGCGQFVEGVLIKNQKQNEDSEEKLKLIYFPPYKWVPENFIKRKLQHIESVLRKHSIQYTKQQSEFVLELS